MFDPEDDESEEETRENQKRAAKWEAICQGQFYDTPPYKEQN